MKRSLLLMLLLISLQLRAQNYERIHNDAIFIDTHNDLLTKTMMYDFILDKDLTGKTYSDLARMKQGGLDMQFFSIWSDGKATEQFKYANRQMDSLDAVVKRNPDKVVKVANNTELYKAVTQHKLAAMFGIEGGHFIENDLSKLDSLYKRGARYMTLTWNNSTDWASSAFDETFTKDLKHKGLTAFGMQVIHRMNELGMMADVSHVGEQTFWDVINTTTKPVIASHSCVYTLCNHQRNLKDDQIKAIAKTGGVIQVNFFSGFLDSTYKKKEEAFYANHKAECDSLTKAGKEDLIEDYIFTSYKSEAEPLRAPFSLLIQHIEYIIKLVGVDHVGIGSDYDGTNSVPVGLNDVTKYPLITKALIEKGYNKKEINKILGGNIIRVLKANEVTK
ncbi:MAG: dipeptidase [Ferruginibacter sp.]